MRQLIIVVVAAAFLMSNTALAQTNLRISPTTTSISAQPGSTQRVRLTLQNPTNKPITVKVTARDFEASSELNGTTQLLASNTSTYSLANWLTDSNLNKQITIPANQSIEYEAVFRVPFSIVPRTHYGSVTFMQESNILAGSLVFITVGTPETKYLIEDLSYSNSADATKPHGLFTATISNTSDALVDPSFRLKITNESGAVISDNESTDQGYVLPGSKRKYILTPSAQLPKELLTATVTSIDQNGITSDKSLQLDRKPAQSIQNQEEQINPDDYAWIPLAVIATISVATIIIFYRIRKKS